MTFLALDLAILFAMILIIAIHTGLGISILRTREKNCTETVIGKIEEIIPRNCAFFTCYSLVCTFNYNGKEYKIRKGLFKTPTADLKEIEIHINPNNPEECYLFKICERCKSFSNK